MEDLGPAQNRHQVSVHARNDRTGPVRGTAGHSATGRTAPEPRRSLKDGSAGRVRPFELADIPQLVELCPRAFPEVTPYPTADYFEEFFFRTPCVDEEIRSLVSETPDGRIKGFIGVMPRRFHLNGETVRVAVGTRLMVAPEARSTEAGLTLFNRFLSGPQDLSMGDAANAPGRIVWKMFRAQTVWPYGVTWRCTLRQAPSPRLRSALLRRKPLHHAAVLAGPLLALVDEAAKGMWRRRRPPELPDVLPTEIDSGTIVANMAGMADRRVLRPHYDRPTLDWLIGRAAAKTVMGDLKLMGVRDRKGVLLGWYIYYLKRRGASAVLQLVAKPQAAASVLDCLIEDAARGGADAVTGRLEPNLLEALSARPHISCHLSPYWMVAHSRRPELMAAIHRGDALFTPLDGEWSMAFRGESFA